MPPAEAFYSAYSQFVTHVAWALWQSDTADGCTQHHIAQAANGEGQQSHHTLRRIRALRFECRKSLEEAVHAGAQTLSLTAEAQNLRRMAETEFGVRVPLGQVDLV